MVKSAEGLLRALCWGQGAFYFLTGVWPLLHRQSFEAVTGPKTDFWLVQTVGALLAATGVLLLRAARRRRIADELALIAALQALTLGVVDLVFALPGRISRIYLLDALAEFPLAIAWAVLWSRAKAAPAA